MARPRNEKLKEQIADVACAQFAEQGYDATSYTSIASACGISRNLCQYHFPKKELLAVEFMERVLAKSVQRLGLTEASLHGNAQAIASVGITYFEMLLEGEGTRRFLLDVISSRELTENVLAFNMGWAIQHFDIPDSYDEAAVRRVVILHMGGFYELLYHCLKEGEYMDVAKELPVVVDAFVNAVSS